MQGLTRFFCAIAVTTILGLSSSASATSPNDIASQAYRGQLKGIGGYQQLILDLNSGRITVTDVIKAAGETPTPELERHVQTFLNDYVQSER